MQLTKNFHLNEFLESQIARRYNITEQFNPPQNIIKNITRLAHVLQRLRDELKLPIVITSGYRCRKVNDIAKGSSTSEHMQGRAVDIYCPSLKNGDFFEKVRKYLNDNKIEFNQLIWEFGDVNNPAWVHVSIPEENQKGRKEVFAIGVGKRF